MAHLCSLFNFIHSLRIPYSPGTKGLMEVRNRNFETHLCLFLQPQTLLLIGHSKPTLMLMLKTLLLVLNLDFRRIKMFSIHTLVLP